VSGPGDNELMRVLVRTAFAIAARQAAAAAAPDHIPASVTPHPLVAGSGVPGESPGRLGPNPAAEDPQGPPRPSSSPAHQPDGGDVTRRRRATTSKKAA